MHERPLAGAATGPLSGIIQSLAHHLTSFVNVVGSASVPLPEVCFMQSLPATACRTEGHRGARLFPGTEPIDQAEELIEESTRSLFGLDNSYRVNAQPHSATQANHAVFRAVLQDSSSPVAALAPTDGGHISHRLGAPAWSPFVPFPLTSRGIDYDELERIVMARQPAIIVGGGSSYTRAIDYPRLRAIADRVGSHLHADLAHMAPFVATGSHPPAFPFADSATIDSSKNLLGPRGGILIYRETDSSAMRRAIFPIGQSSPNQNGLFGKAASLYHWATGGLDVFCQSMRRLAVALSKEIERYVGAPVFGGTDSHLLLFDLSDTPLDGREAEDTLEQARVLVNRNQVPGDQGSPWKPAGIRLGTTALAALGYWEDDAQVLGDVIGKVVAGEPVPPERIQSLLDTYHRPLISTISPQGVSAGDPLARLVR